MTCLMTVRRAGDVVTDITLEGPASWWAYPGGNPIPNYDFIDGRYVKSEFPPCIKIGSEIMEIIRCVDIEEEKQDG